jgi:valyl-tRNA synthetase
MIRYKKLCGFRTIFIPGTDHAGIATQTKFEKILKQKGTNPHSLSREKFLDMLME